MSQIEFGNQELIKLIQFLKKASKETNSAIWLNIADQLSKSKRSRRIVNLNRIDRFTKEGDTLVVPGKVLGTGALSHQVNVAALSFSKEAAAKIQEIGGKCLTIRDLYKLKKDGSNVKIMG